MNRKLLGNIVFGLAIAIFALLVIASYAFVGHPRQLNPMWAQQHAR